MLATMRGLLVVLLFALGCDSKARAADPQAVPPRPELKGKEYESCGASLHCAEDLRCFDNTCRRVARSVVGDYYAAVGAAAKARGEHEPAIAAYASALAQYDAEKLEVPPDVDCAYGAALAGAKDKKQQAELAARVLHRCVLAVPAGSRLREAAIAQLATLADVGLDPLLLGAAKTADLYLTKGPTAPATDKLTVDAQLTPAPAKTGPVLTARLAESDVRTALVACWEQNRAATKSNTLSATMQVQVAYVASEYDDVAGRYVWKFPTPEAPASCVRQALEPVLKALKPLDSFNSKLTVVIQ